MVSKRLNFLKGIESTWGFFKNIFKKPKLIKKNEE
jgi:hypothetical protein